MLFVLNQSKIDFYLGTTHRSLLGLFKSSSRYYISKTILGLMACFVWYLDTVDPKHSLTIWFCLIFKCHYNTRTNSKFKSNTVDRYSWKYWPIPPSNAQDLPCQAKTYQCSQTAYLSPFTDSINLLRNKAPHCLQVPHSSPLLRTCQSRIVIWHNSKQKSRQCEAQPFCFHQQASVGSRESNSGRVTEQ